MICIQILQNSKTICLFKNHRYIFFFLLTNFIAKLILDFILIYLQLFFYEELSS